MLAADLVMMPLALFSAITLRLGTFDHHIGGGGWLYVAVVVVTVPVFTRLGLYRAVIRYIGARALFTVVTGVTLSVLLLLVLNLTVTHKEVPVTAFVIYWALAMLYVAGSRFVVRLALQGFHGGAERARVAIYGAGDAGVRVAMALQAGNELNPIVFVDDNRALHGSVMSGIEVFSPDELPALLEEYSIATILLAVPGETRRRRREILTRLESLGVHVQTIPDLSDIASGRARVDEMREVDVTDLLGRDSVPPNHALLRVPVSAASPSW